MMRRFTIGTLAALAMLRVVPAGGQQVALQTLSAVELWKTDDSSRLLSHNNGRVAVHAQVYVWSAVQFTPGLELRATGYLEGGTLEESRVSAELDLLSLRYVQSRALTLEAGKIFFPMGAFGPRRYANTNPLIGAPDSYASSYPVGVVVSGATGALDYRGGLVSQPLVNVNYTPEPGDKLRPVLGAGWTVGPALHFGVSATRGPYLNSNVRASLPPGAAWDSFHQSVLGADARFSMGYVETRAEAVWSSYDVPGAANATYGMGWYGEVRGTLSPRVFVAGRFESLRTPFVQPGAGAAWFGATAGQMNAEAGLGYRLSADALVKASLRRDHWALHTLSDGTRLPDGYAFAIQFSLTTDLVALLQGQR